ncbi:coiled-coil domain-containing protein 9-like isoform X2 [Pristis pectinata]|uniref:coiled-coil domain-containing protein 9-like isoform X2 n=1 Tax=Pristis pectinata TaxID=685728 RepID=UPI00223DEA49|nr:coiled-coil domain-containing protein 9-like isoform X2 [Pristis pectinata]XP_051874636.1 coiled-coil domain-containing protein 9-like isoform X2 [Pristis pectinata]
MMDAAVDIILKTKEEKDAELDKKIEALRKKNEALMKRYHEIEEDKKRAELEGMAVITRKSRPESLTITITKSPNEKRVVSEKRMFGGGSGLKGCEADAGQRFSIGRGQRLRRFVVEESKAKEWEERRKQNIEKMNEEMEKIAEYERSQQEGKVDKNPFRNFLDDRRRTGPLPEGDKKVGSRRNVRNWGGSDFEMVKSGIEKKRCEKGWQEGGIPTQKGTVDMTMLMTGRERAEYIRWKKEREQIDQERLARHKNSKGEWKRAWDANKTEDMFQEDFAVENELGFHKRKGGRNARKCNVRFQHHDIRDDGNHSDKTKELFPWSEATDSSKSKGKDRLTGRARSFKMNNKAKTEIQRDAAGQDAGEDTDDSMNVEWDVVEPRDCQASSLDTKEVQRALMDDEETVNKLMQYSRKLGNLSLAEELMQINPVLCHNISGKTNSGSPSENGISDHSVLSGCDLQDLEETGNVLNYCSSKDTSKQSEKSILVASDTKSDQSIATEKHVPIKDGVPLALELSACPDTLDDNSAVLEKDLPIAICDEERKIFSSAADVATECLAACVKLQDQSAEEAMGKLQPALKTDVPEILHDDQKISAPDRIGGNGCENPENYQEERSEENKQNYTDYMDEMPGISAVALKPSTKIPHDAAALDIIKTMIGMMVEEK